MISHDHKSHTQSSNTGAGFTPSRDTTMAQMSIPGKQWKVTDGQQLKLLKNEVGKRKWKAADLTRLHTHPVSPLSILLSRLQSSCLAPGTEAVGAYFCWALLPTLR